MPVKSRMKNYFIGLTALVLSVFMLFAFSSCKNNAADNPEAGQTEEKTTDATQNAENEAPRKETGMIEIIVKGKSFSAVLENNETATAFAARLPLTLDMSELNGNEKYHYLKDAFPSDSQSVGQIHAGDIMLYGNDCIVLFYKDFSTVYSYTRIGKIRNPQGLEEALGNGNASVEFKLKNN